MGMFCTNCGNKLDDGCKFCGVCGAPVAASANVTPAPVEAAAAPVETAPVPVVAPVATLKPRGGILRHDIAGVKGIGALYVVLSILLSFSLLLGIVVSVANSAISNDGVEKVFENVELSEVEIGVDEHGNSVTLTDYLYSRLRYNPNFEMSQRELARFIDKSGFKDYIEEKTQSIVHDVCYNDNDTEITAAEIRRLLERNENFLEDMGYSLTPSMREYVVETVMNDKLVEMINDGTLLRDTDTEFLRYIPLATSPIIVVLLVVFAVICALLLFVVSRKTLVAPIMSLGISLACVGGVYLLIALIAALLPVFIGDWYATVYFILCAVRNIVATGIVASVIILFVGAALIACAVVLRGYVKKQRVRIASEG